MEILIFYDSKYSKADSIDSYIVEESSPISPRGVIKNKIDFFNDHIFATLDGIAMTDRQAMRLISAVVQAMGFRLRDLVLSRTTIRRKRIEYRKKTASIIKNQFKVNQQRKNQNYVLNNKL